MSFVGELWLPENQPRRLQVEAVELSRKALRSWERHTETHLSPEDFEDFHAELVFIATREAAKFDARKGVSIDAYLYGRLVLRATDVLRKRLGRSRWQWADKVYERAVEPAPLSLDARTGDDSRTLGELVAAEDRSGQADSDEVLRWLIATRDCTRVGDVRVIRSAIQEASQKRAA